MNYKGKALTVVSLFDGMSCGRVALEKAGIEVRKYYASEIDKHAMKVSSSNWPEIVQMGDVSKWRDWDIDWSDVDLLLAGSPCQGFSFAGKQLAFNDERSKLYFEFESILLEKKPKMFILENVKMSKVNSDVISGRLGINPATINSNAFSAQNRHRLYWTNIQIPEFSDKGITLDQIIDHEHEGNKIKNWGRYVPESLPRYADPYNCKELIQKSTTLRTNVHNGNMWVRTECGYRNLTRIECEKLQTVPVGYTNAVSETQAKKMLGNGWTVDVIKHILSGIGGGAEE